jgi:small conductance mechanosensitive channel
MDKLMEWMQPAGEFMARKLLPMVALTVLGIVTVHILMKLVRKMLEKSKLEKAAHTLILTVCQIALYVLLALIVASGLGIDVTSLVAMASVLTLAISLAVQNLLANVFGGFTLLYTKPFASEDFVEIAGQSGTVKEIGLSYTKLATADNKVVSIPNSAVVAAEIVNYTVTGTRRLDINLEVSYSVAPELVLEILEKAADHPLVLSDPAQVIAIKEYNQQSITYGIMLWCDTSDYWTLKFDINRELSRRALEAGITFYDPHLHVHLDK